MSQPSYELRITCFSPLRKPNCPRIQVQTCGKQAYNQDMARGWDSKAVEEQIESKTSEFVAVTTKRRTPDQVQKLIEKRNLEAARAKVLHEIDATQNERYKEMLRRSLRDLEGKLAELHC